MQVSVEVSQGLERRMTVDVPKERIEEEVDKRLKSLARTSRLKGFRPGKVPMNVVRQRYGQKVREDVTREMLESTYQEALAREQLRPVGPPNNIELHNQELDKPQDLSYTVNFEVYPENLEISLDNISVERLSADIQPEDVDEVLETMRRQQATWKEVERPAQDGDQVILDYTLSEIDSPESILVTQTRQGFILGQAVNLPSLEEALRGARTGETLDVDLAEAPADFFHPELAGKALRFNISVKAVREPELPEIDEAFSQAFGISDGVEALREAVRENMRGQLTQTVWNRLKDQLMAGLRMANAEMEVPKTLIQQEVTRILEQWEEQGNNAARPQPGEDELWEEASRRIKVGLMLDHLARKHQIVPDPSRIAGMIQNIASTYEDPQTVINWFRQQPSAMREIEAGVLEDMVMEWVLNQVTVTERQVSFKEIINPGSVGGNDQAALETV